MNNIMNNSEKQIIYMINKLLAWMLRPSVRNIVSLSSLRFCTDARLMPDVWQMTAFSASRSITDVISRAVLMSPYYTTANIHLTARVTTWNSNNAFNSMLCKTELLLEKE